MNYITNSTFKKIFTTLTISEINCTNSDQSSIDCNLEFIKKIMSSFKEPENIVIQFYHKFHNKYLNSFEDKEYGTCHSLYNCSILLSDYKDIEISPEIIEKTVDKYKRIGKTQSEIIDLVRDEISKLKKIVHKHFPNLDDIDPSNNTLKKEIYELLGIEMEIKTLFAKNSGSVKIENIDLKELESKVELYISLIINPIGIQMPKEDILTIMFKLTRDSQKLEYSTPLLSDYEEIIIQNFNSLSKDLIFDMRCTFNLYFKIIFNKSIPFDGHLFSHLNLLSCQFDCGIESLRQIEEILFNKNQ